MIGRYQVKSWLAFALPPEKEDEDCPPKRRRRQRTKRATAASIPTPGVTPRPGESVTVQPQQQFDL